MISQRTLGLRKISLQCVERARMSLRMDRYGSCTMLADAMPKTAVAILRTRQGIYTHALFRLPNAGFQFPRKLSGYVCWLPSCLLCYCCFQVCDAAETCPLVFACALSVAHGPGTLLGVSRC